MLPIVVNTLQDTSAALLVRGAAMSAAYFILVARLLAFSGDNQEHTIGKGKYSNYTL